VEVLRSPVTKVETINLPTTVTRVSSGPSSASAYAAASTSSAIPVSRIESYSSGDSSNGEIRDLLRSVLSELRNGGGRSTVTLSAPSSSYSSVGDSYGAPPRNTFTDPNSPSYPDSISIARKPEKVQVQQVVVQQEQRQNTSPVFAVSSVSSAPAVREIVRTVYQPVYVPVQVSQPEIYTQTVAVPTTVKTGASAVAFSTIHEQPAYTLQQQQVQVPVQLQQVQQVQQYAVSSGYSNGGGYQETAVLEGGYKKKK